MATISGAIFDCDGTIVDSMQMWYTVFDDLIRAHGIVPTLELRERIEPMTIPAACEMLYAEFGMGQSAQALRDELEAMVAHAYETEIAPMPGAIEFVRSLKAAGVPMVIASSTTSWLVRDALAVQGIDDCFADVLCTAEVRDGRDKDFPDVYEEALARLGTPVGQTWVFEDAPFAIRSARSLGLHVAAIFNDHDGRDEALIRAWSDLFSMNYDELSLEAIRAFDDGSRRPVPEGE